MIIKWILPKCTIFDNENRFAIQKHKKKIIKYNLKWQTEQLLWAKQRQRKRAKRVQIKAYEIFKLDFIVQFVSTSIEMNKEWYTREKREREEAGLLDIYLVI